MAKPAPKSKVRLTAKLSAKSSNPARSSTPIHILSDSTGNLAFHMLTAFVTQFPPGAFVLKRRNFLRNESDIEAALEAAAKNKAIVFHALVSPQLKDSIAKRCAAANLACCDLTGPFVDFLAKNSGLSPQPNIQRLHDISDEYHGRIKAIEFTLEHDDALGLPTIHQADAVLVGISRTSKTPTSVYLAQQGYFIANVALAKGVDPPAELLKLPPAKVIGLVIDPIHLADIRSTRQASWHMGDTRYNDPEAVREEVIWSKRLFASRGWKTIDVTNQAIEETAARIVNILNLPPPSVRLTNSA